MDVLEKNEKVAVGSSEDGFISALEEMSYNPEFSVKVHGEVLVNAPQDLGQTNIPRLQRWRC
jgi:hypothetical protein